MENGGVSRFLVRVKGKKIIFHAFVGKIITSTEQAFLVCMPGEVPFWRSIRESTGRPQRRVRLLRSSPMERSAGHQFETSAFPEGFPSLHLDSHRPLLEVRYS